MSAPVLRLALLTPPSTSLLRPEPPLLPNGELLPTSLARRRIWAAWGERPVFSGLSPPLLPNGELLPTSLAQRRIWVAWGELLPAAWAEATIVQVQGPAWPAFLLLLPYPLLTEACGETDLGSLGRTIVGGVGRRFRVEPNHR
jgi:hypothetical protein